MTIAEFRQIVDSLNNDVEQFRSELDDLYDFYGLPKTNSRSTAKVEKEIYKRICACFTSEHKANQLFCGQLSCEVIHDHVLRDEPLEPYIPILRRIQDALRTCDKIVTPAADDWVTASQLAFDLCLISPWGDNEATERLYACDLATARAVVKLRSRGFNVDLDKGQVKWEKSEAQRVGSHLASLSDRLSGRAVAENIFHLLEPLYDDSQERYQLVRRVNPLGTDVEPQIPFGYLLNLSGRSAFLSPEGDTKGLWAELVELSTSYAAIQHVQPFNTFQLMFNNHSTIVAFLRELVFFDSLFTIPQIRPLDSIRIVYGVLQFLDWGKEREGGWTLSEAVELAETMLSQARHIRGPQYFTESYLASLCQSIAATRVSTILNRIFSHQPPGANQDYELPTHSPGPNLLYRPLLSDAKGNYCILDASIAGIGVLESILTELRPEEPKLDDRLGLAIETFLEQQLSTHGVKTSRGSYVSGRQDGECDLVVETSDAILIFEIKKKPLTRKAQAGLDTAVLLDLSASMLDAQLQAGWHEIRLRRGEALTLLTDDGKRHSIALKGREIERIAVSFLDFGSLQDRLVLRQFLEVSLGAEYSPSDLKLKKKFDQLSDKLRKLREQQKELVTLDGRRKSNPFFNCWFLSVPQLMILLDEVTDNESFKSALWAVRHISTGSLNFYFELQQAQMMSKFSPES